MPLAELTQQTALSPQEVSAALEILCHHDVVKNADNAWQFTVELMRRWVVAIKL